MFFVRRSLWQRTLGEPMCERCLLSDSVSTDKVSGLGMSSRAKELQERKSRFVVNATLFLPLTCLWSDAVQGPLCFHSVDHSCASETGPTSLDVSANCMWMRCCISIRSQWRALGERVIQTVSFKHYLFIQTGTNRCSRIKHTWGHHLVGPVRDAQQKQRSRALFIVVALRPRCPTHPQHNATSHSCISSSCIAVTVDPEKDWWKEIRLDARQWDLNSTVYLRARLKRDITKKLLPWVTLLLWATELLKHGNVISKLHFEMFRLASTLSVIWNRPLLTSTLDLSPL